VAAKKAIIEKVLVEKGVAAVQKGQLVHPGEILINGSLGAGNANVHAKGKIEALVWYVSDIQVPYQSVRKQYTGPSFKKQYLVLGSFPIQVWGYGQNPYPTYEEHGEDREFYIASYTLPIRLRTVDVKETFEESIIRTEEEAKTEAIAQTTADVMAKIANKGQVVEQKVLQQRSEHGNLYIKVLHVVIEDIGKPQPF
jgi:similar to stage IV sporulation protein